MTAKRSIQRCRSAPVMRGLMREKKVTISANLRLDHELMSRRKKGENLPFCYFCILFRILLA